MSIAMDKRQQTAGRDAFSLFPDLMKNILASGRKDANVEYGQVSDEAVSLKKDPVTGRNPLLPPPPPDLGFLESGREERGEQNDDDVPTAMLLLADNATREMAAAGLRDLGYRVEGAITGDDAVSRLKSGSYATLIMDPDFDGSASPAQSTVHHYISRLPMARRRRLFYVLVGDFQTLYDLEALAWSANLVINRADMGFLRPILKKSYREYEELFGPLFSALGADGLGVVRGKLT
ncbi:MAG: hypothetical protein ABFR63_12495 [Thermodesulfobacteriota bacterium]